VLDVGRQRPDESQASATTVQNLGHRHKADLVAFGTPFLANPDLPLRYLRGAPLNAPDPATFYAGEEKGYVDYPALTAIAAE